MQGITRLLSRRSRRPCSSAVLPLLTLLFAAALVRGGENEEPDSTTGLPLQDGAIRCEIVTLKKGAEFSRSEITYDRNDATLVETELYFLNNEQSYKKTSRYKKDSKGKWLKKEQTEQHLDDDRSYTRTYAYNENGKLLIETFRHESKEEPLEEQDDFRYRYEYDKYGNRTYMVVEYPKEYEQEGWTPPEDGYNDGRLETWTTYTRAEDGTMHGIETGACKKTTATQSRRENDESGAEIRIVEQTEQTFIHDNLSQEAKKTWKYSKDGRKLLIRTETTNSPGTVKESLSVTEWRYAYDHCMRLSTFTTVWFDPIDAATPLRIKTCRYFYPD